MRDFAFDFWQNSKYNCRRVDTSDNAATQANERQIDKSLAEMGK